ncbi:MAG: rhodoquinone biosynthesis methyltransferase RquA [Rhodocyclaceae bacterium]|nr:rhodoquinone biosynthesis methyltransferase RquA [Rhodocyclaceae bacterium]
MPEYLEKVYWWAYVRPAAVRLFERPWLVNLILFGRYRRLCNAALDALGNPVCGRSLQVACVYGALTPRLYARLAEHASLDVVDVLPQQLRNLEHKLPRGHRVRLLQQNSAALLAPDAFYDQVLVFFLLHEQPVEVRRRTLAEALRVTRPGGRVVIVDYHCPQAWHPLRPLLRGVLGTLEPFALDLWRAEITDFLPSRAALRRVDKRLFFGGLYQLVVLHC